MEDATLSYWRKHPPAPKSIRDPEQRDGSDAIAIACTQTDLPAAAQTKLVARRCKLLPTLGHVKRLWLNSLYRNACSMRYANAGRRGSVDQVELDQIDGAGREAESPAQFHLGGSAQVQSLDELASLEQLEWQAHCQRYDDLTERHRTTTTA